MQRLVYVQTHYLKFSVFLVFHCYIHFWKIPWDISIKIIKDPFNRLFRNINNIPGNCMMGKPCLCFKNIDIQPYAIKEEPAAGTGHFLCCLALLCLVL